MGSSGSIAIDGTSTHGMHAPNSPLFDEYLALAEEAGWHDLLAKENLTVGSRDCLVVVDMQNDFIPADSLNPDGGAFAVAEGALIVPLIVQLMEHFAASGGLVVATRDYHPIDHCSFIPSGGPFPRHCVQGSVGSHFYVTIGQCLKDLRALGRRAEVVFKGIHEDIDSFGSFEYPDNPDTWSRVANNKGKTDRLHGCSHCAWTGCMSLKCSNIGADINAPPDVLSPYNRMTLTELLKKQGIQRIFACGLAMDFCVLDTCLNAKAAVPGISEVALLMDAARAAHLPGLGQIGSGFLQDLKDLGSKLRNSQVAVRPSSTLLPSSFKAAGSMLKREMIGRVFPEQLGPWAFVPVQDLRLSLDKQNLTYTAFQDAPGEDIQALRLYGIQPQGKVSPMHALTLSASTLESNGIPASATHYMWAYAVSHGSFEDQARAYFSITTPAAAFFVFGGFVYLDAKGAVVAVMSLTLGKGLHFGARGKWQSQFTAALRGRWQPVTAPFMKQKGAQKFVWIPPNEVFVSKDKKEKWTAPKHGCFAYLFHEDETGFQDERDCFFPVAEMSVPTLALGRISKVVSGEISPKAYSAFPDYSSAYSGPDHDVQVSLYAPFVVHGCAGWTGFGFDPLCRTKK